MPPLGLAHREAVFLRVVADVGCEAVDELTRHHFTAVVVDSIAEIPRQNLDASALEYSIHDVVDASGYGFRCCVKINSAPAWDYGTKESLVERTENLLSELKKIRYVPCELSAVSDPRYDCGDMVSLPLDEGTTIDTIVTKITWRLGRMEITGTGKNPYLYGIAPKKTQIIRELQQQTTSNKMIFYSFFNSTDVVASGTEVKPLASVTFVTVEDTSAMFLAQLPDKF